MQTSIGSSKNCSSQPLGILLQQSMLPPVTAKHLHPYKSMTCLLEALLTLKAAHNGIKQPLQASVDDLLLPQPTWQNIRMKNAAVGSVMVSLQVMIFPGMAPCSGTIAVSTTTAWGRFLRINSPVRDEHHVPGKGSKRFVSEVQKGAKN